VKSIAALFLSSVFAGPLWAQQSGPVKVPFEWGSSGEEQSIFNPNEIYQGTVRYFVQPANSSMTITVDGAEYTVDWNSVVQEAIDEWRQALAGTNLAIEPASDEGQANLVISIENSGLQSGPFNPGGTNLMSATSPTRTRFYSDQFQVIFNNGAAQKYFKYIQGGAPELLRFLTRLTAKHELGHALGLDHAGLLVGPAVTVNGPLFRAAIMMPDPFLFTADLWAQVNHLTPADPPANNPPTRLVTADDIAITAPEADALAALVRTQQDTCTGGSSLFSCIKAPFIDYPHSY
jgi:hypothetical protein